MEEGTLLDTKQRKLPKYNTCCLLLEGVDGVMVCSALTVQNQELSHEDCRAHLCSEIRGPLWSRGPGTSTRPPSFDKWEVISWCHWSQDCFQGHQSSLYYLCHGENPLISQGLTIPFCKWPRKSLPALTSYDLWMKGLKMHDKGFRLFSVITLPALLIPKHLWGMG